MLGVRRLVRLSNRIVTYESGGTSDGGYRAISPNQLQVQLSATQKGPASPLGQTKKQITGVFYHDTR